MQGVARKPDFRFHLFRPSMRDKIQIVATSLGVDLIAQQGKADMREVHTHLMSASRLWPCFQEGKAPADLSIRGALPRGLA